jgi:hypothetical protein
MSLSAEVFGSDSWVHKLVNVAGLGIPGWADRKFGTGGPDPQYNSLGDMSRQTAEEGSPRVIVWGRVRPIGGNLIYCQEPQTQWTVSFQQTAGKGGDEEEQEVWTQRVYRTYAIGVCEGPISRFVRVWQNNKLVYDARGNDWGIRNNPIFLSKNKFYTGAWSQLPCPELQAIFGTDIPAHRGTAYMVCINHDLTEMGGAVPQYQFEVERAEGVYLTSRPYAAEGLEGIASDPMSVRATPYVEPDLIEHGAAEITGGVLRDPLHVYDDGLPEAIDAGAPEITGGEFRSIYDSYTVPPEAVDAGAPEITAGELREALISYDEWPAEAIDAGAPEITGGTLT